MFGARFQQAKSDADKTALAVEMVNVALITSQTGRQISTSCSRSQRMLQRARAT